MSSPREIGRTLGTRERILRYSKAEGNFKRSRKRNEQPVNFIKRRSLRLYFPIEFSSSLGNSEAQSAKQSCSGVAGIWYLRVYSLFMALTCSFPWWIVSHEDEPQSGRWVKLRQSLQRSPQCLSIPHVSDITAFCTFEYARPIRTRNSSNTSFYSISMHADVAA